MTIVQILGCIIQSMREVPTCVLQDTHGFLVMKLLRRACLTVEIMKLLRRVCLAEEETCQWETCSGEQTSTDLGCFCLFLLLKIVSKTSLLALPFSSSVAGHLDQHASDRSSLGWWLPGGSAAAGGRPQLLCLRSCLPLHPSYRSLLKSSSG